MEASTELRRRGRVLKETGPPTLLGVTIYVGVDEDGGRMAAIG